MHQHHNYKLVKDLPMPMHIIGVHFPSTYLHVGTLGIYSELHVINLSLMRH